MILRLLLVSLVATAAVTACSAGNADLGGSGPNAGENPATCANPPCSSVEGDAQPSNCAAPDNVIVPAGGAVNPRPTGSSLRLDLVYKGDVLGITGVRAVDAVVPGGSQPLQAGVNSGHWAELRDGAGAALYTELINDPTRIEAPGAPGGGGFESKTRSHCESKSIYLDLPNNPSGKAILIFGSAYGTTGVARELARFVLP